MVEDSFFNRAVFGFLTKSGDFKNQSGAKTPAELALLLLALPLLLTLHTLVELLEATEESHQPQRPFEEFLLILFSQLLANQGN